MRVLLVEDDPAQQGALEAILKMEGHAVDHAGNGEAALTRLALATPDVILLDLYMPGMDGLTFLREARARGWSAVPVLLATAGAPDVIAEVEEAARALGPLRLVQKPYALPDVLRALEEMAVTPRT